MMAQKVLQRLGGSKGLSRLSWNGKWLMQNYVYHELTVGSFLCRFFIYFFNLT